MSQSAVAFTHLDDSSEAGTFLGSRIRSGLDGKAPDALILFASSRYNHAKLLAATQAACHAEVLVGCTSAGEFINGLHGEGSAVAIALRSSTMMLSVGVGRNLRANVDHAARDLVSGFNASATEEYPYRSAMILTDALAGQADQLIEQIMVWSAGGHQLFGGAAGDDVKFEKTHVFCGQEVITDAAVALEIRSKFPIGVGVQHGWVPASDPMRVTSAQGATVVSLNASPILDVMLEFAKKTDQTLDLNDPMPFFLHNIIGIETKSGYKLRVPLGVMPDRSIGFSAEVPEGAVVRIMYTDPKSGKETISSAIDAAFKQLGPHKPGIALLFDCVATRLRYGQAYSGELESIQKKLGSLPYTGLNTYGQIVRAEGQFSGFHNSSLLVCVLPE